MKNEELGMKKTIIFSAMALVLMVIILICMGVMNQFDSDEEKEGSVVI